MRFRSFFLTTAALPLITTSSFASDSIDPKILAKCDPKSITHASFDGWDLNCYKNSAPVLVRSNSNLKLMLKSDAGRSSTITRVRKIKNLELIDYYTGEQGTKNPKKTYSTVIFNTATKEFVGDFPAPDSQGEFSPQWDTGETSIVIREPQDSDGSFIKTTIEVSSGRKLVETFVGRARARKTAK